MKNIFERLLLFVSPQNTIAKSSGKFELYKTLSIQSIFFKHNNFVRSNAVTTEKRFFNISINIIIKSLHAFEIFYFTLGKLGGYHVA